VPKEIGNDQKARGIENEERTDGPQYHGENAEHLDSPSSAAWRARTARIGEIIARVTGRIGSI
jgi:hypothetical protein